MQKKNIYIYINCVVAFHGQADANGMVNLIITYSQNKLTLLNSIQSLNSIAFRGWKNGVVCYIQRLTNSPHTHTKSMTHIRIIEE